MVSPFRGWLWARVGLDDAGSRDLRMADVGHLSVPVRELARGRRAVPCRAGAGRLAEAGEPAMAVDQRPLRPESATWRPGLVAFLGIAALVIVTPGPDTVLTIRNTVQRRAARADSARRWGWRPDRQCGPSPPARASPPSSWHPPPAFGVLRLAGAVYLVWLGLHAMWTAVHAPAGRMGRAADVDGRPASGCRARSGVPAGRRQQSRQPQDGRLLHEPAPAVRAGRRRLVPRRSSAWVFSSAP